MNFPHFDWITLSGEARGGSARPAAPARLCSPFGQTENIYKKNQPDDFREFSANMRPELHALTAESQLGLQEGSSQRLWSFSVLIVWKTETQKVEPSDPPLTQL